MNQEGVFFMDMKPNNEIKSNSNNKPNTEAPSTNRDALMKKTEAISKAKNKLKKESSKKEKKGFWNKLFGK